MIASRTILRSGVNRPQNEHDLFCCRINYITDVLVIEKEINKLGDRKVVDCDNRFIWRSNDKIHNYSILQVYVPCKSHRPCNP